MSKQNTNTRCANLFEYCKDEISDILNYTVKVTSDFSVLHVRVMAVQRSDLFVWVNLLWSFVRKFTRPSIWHDTVKEDTSWRVLVPAVVTGHRTQTLHSIFSLFLFLTDGKSYFLVNSPISLPCHLSPFAWVNDKVDKDDREEMNHGLRSSSHAQERSCLQRSWEWHGMHIIGCYNCCAWRSFR